MSIYGLDQYLSDDTQILDLSEIIPEKLFLNGNFVTFTAELNAYLSGMQSITQLTISSSLLEEIIGTDFNYVFYYQWTNLKEGGVFRGSSQRLITRRHMNSVG